MSFAVYVPCSCAKSGRISLPSFLDQLELRDGIYDIKAVFSNDADLIKRYDDWRFCSHNQIAIEMDLGQSIIGIKPYIKGKHGIRFKNLIDFLPDYNAYHSTQYNKPDLLRELKELREIEPELVYRWNQFIVLVEVAIKNGTWVYF